MPVSFPLLRSACLGLALSVVVCGVAVAQAKEAPQDTAQAPSAANPGTPEEPIKQIALTEKQIKDAIRAQKDIEAATANPPENTAADQKSSGQLDDVATKYDFTSYDEYQNVMANISLVLDGFDSTTKKYVGFEAIIKAQIKKIEADKTKADKDKKLAIKDLNVALKSPPKIENRANIDLVTKHYDELMTALYGNQD